MKKLQNNLADFVISYSFVFYKAAKIQKKCVFKETLTKKTENEAQITPFSVF
jgi:hypothetical protein